MMEIGIFAKTFAGSDPETVLRAVKANGYETCQYNMACSGLSSLPQKISPVIINAIDRARAQTGIGIAALSATYNMIHPNEDERRKGLQALRVLAATARDLRIPLLTLCTGTCNANDQWTHHPDNQSQQSWRTLRKEMDLALQIADEFDISLGVEPEHANVVNSAEAARRLLDETASPRVKIVIDPANLVATETGTAQQRLIGNAIERLGDAITMAHAKDRDGAGLVVAAGRGIIDFPFFLRELAKLRRDIPLVTHGLDATDARDVCKTLSTTLANI